MKGLTVLFGVLASIMLVIYSAGDPASIRYLDQTMFQGQSVFVEDGNTAVVDGSEMAVAHQGFTNMDTFEIADIISLETEQMILEDGNYTNETLLQEYVVLAHEIGGVFGKATPLLTPSDSDQFTQGDDAELYGQDITYVGSFKASDGITKHLYDVGGTVVVVSMDTYSFVQTDDVGNGIVLRQELNGNVSVGNTSKPFDITTEQFGKLLAVIAVGMIVGYTVMWSKDKIYGTVD
jgi:hypothetical protein